ncbi:hypothetical protein K1719_027752 [Acacia pycnantha]|nr:hypothetical protein K1719_027752 [Acacia pycnantha]
MEVAIPSWGPLIKLIDSQLAGELAFSDAKDVNIWWGLKIPAYSFLQKKKEDISTSGGGPYHFLSNCIPCLMVLSVVFAS